MKKYDSYKDSGVEWIGSIPSHWESMPLKRYGRFNKGLSFTKADLVSEGKPVVSYGQVHSKLNKGTSLRNELIRFVPDSIANSEASLVEKGDFIFADTSEDLEGSGNVVYNDTNDNVYGGYHTVLFQTKNNDNKYLAYLFTTDCWRSQIRSRVGGVKVYSITQYILGLSSIILPPLAEQKKIASYLDEQTSRIDNIIQARENKIKLLEELRAAIISKAVTKGIRKNVETKDSGIEWIGQVPKHWEVALLKRYASIQTGTTPNTNDERYWQDPTIDWYTPVDFHGDLNLSPSKRKVTEVAINEFACPKYLPNTVLIVGIGATLGNVGISLTICSSNQQLNAVIFGNKIKPQYGAYYLSSIKDVMRSVANSSTLAIMNQTTTKNLLMLCPPIEEQDEIVNYIEIKNTDIKLNIEKANKEIGLLKEYRSSLITEVVTGKRKVI